MNLKIGEATLSDGDKGLLDVFIEWYKYHQNGRPDIFTTTSVEKLKEDLIGNFDNLSPIIILDNDVIVGYLSYKIKGKCCKNGYWSINNSWKL